MLSSSLVDVHAHPKAVCHLATQVKLTAHAHAKSNARIQFALASRTEGCITEEDA